ncbi:MAG: helix-turn-helix domain-containing protein [Steroidobacteraceae bacterium]|jgi:IclR family pca regulon transcriptional regulator|nr:helix-turn-helix domain-containing protein [Steroidobacteraceae bacterium]
MNGVDVADEELSPGAGDSIADDSDRDYVNSLARGLEVICAFTRSTPRMSLSDVARATAMTRATARRLLLTLVREGYAQQDGKYFSLRPKVLRLGYSALASMNIWDVAQPIMNQLAATLKESVFAAVLDGHDVVYVARANSDRLVSIGITIGSRAPAHAVSTGRVLLASRPEAELQQYLETVNLVKFTPNTVVSKVKLRELIEEARAGGWSIVDQELEVGLRSISVPIRNAEGHVVAALNVCCPSSRLTPEQMRNTVLAELMTASQAITAGLQS